MSEKIRIENALERLDILFRKWGITSDDWMLKAGYALRLQGYPVWVRKDHLNIKIKRNKLPWKTNLKFDVFPPKGSIWLKQFKDWIKTTGFDTDLIPVSSVEMKKLQKASIFYILPNGRKIRLITPIGQIKDLEQHLKECLNEDVGREKAIRILMFPGIMSDRKIALKKGDIESVKICDRILKRYEKLIQDYKKEQLILKKTAKKDIKQFNGVIASRGIATGKVRVILNFDKTQHLHGGEILVTKTVTPALILAIDKIAGIITDEGGIMSHAAILAREFKIPCIVGTKISTKVLRNGDLIKLDAEGGTVEKLN